jgi:hypothetical protein
MTHERLRAIVLFIIGLIAIAGLAGFVWSMAAWLCEMSC